MLNTRLYKFNHSRAILENGRQIQVNFNRDFILQMLQTSLRDIISNNQGSQQIIWDSSAV